MLNDINRLVFNWFVLIDPICLPGLQNKSVFASNLFYRKETHITMIVPSWPEVDSNWLDCVSLARLHCRTKMLTKSHFSWSRSATNVLWFQPSTCTSILGAPQGIHNTGGGTSDVVADSELFPSEVACVGGGVHRMGADRAVCSLPTLLKPCAGFSFSLSVGWWWQLTPDYNVLERLGLGGFAM